MASSPAKPSFAVAHSWIHDRDLSRDGPVKTFKLVRSSLHGDIESIRVEVGSAYNTRLRISFEIADGDLLDDGPRDKAKAARANLLKEMGLRPLGDKPYYTCLYSRHLEEARIMWKYLCQHYIIPLDAINEVNTKLGISAATPPVDTSSSSSSNKRRRSDGNDDEKAPTTATEAERKKLTDETVILAIDGEGALYGDVFAIGCSKWLAGKEVDTFYLRADHKETKEFQLPAGNPRNRYITLDEEKKEVPGFIMENVIPALDQLVTLNDEGDTTVPGIDVGSLKELRSKFWTWYRACVNDCTEKKLSLIVVADWGAPIEAALFRACINDFEGDDFEKAQWQGPTPLHEVSSMYKTLEFQYGKALVASKIDPSHRLPDTEMPAHHPLADARQTARLAYECLSFKPHPSPLSHPDHGGDHDGW